MIATAPPATINTPTGEPRYVFIDALRGIAAMAVVCYHMEYSPLHDALARTLPAIIRSVFHFGFLGVNIFFVLSGFVIAHSIRNTVLGPKSVAMFALRRQLRLDPPYWAAVFGSLALMAVMRRALGAARTEPIPGINAVFLNLLYLQKIAGVTEIVTVGWTLCIEIQFYLFFIMVLWLGQRRRSAGDPTAITKALVCLSGAGSLILDPSLQNATWFAPYWCFFAAGVLCYWALRGTASNWVFIFFVILMCVSSLRHTFNAPLYMGVVAILGIYVVGVAGQLTTLLGGRALQYLGRISYSLYLVHWPVKIVVLSAGFALTRQNGAAAVGWCVLMVLISIGVAHVLYVVVERPSMRWASWFKEKPTHALAQPGGTSSQDGGARDGTVSLDGVASC